MNWSRSGFERLDYWITLLQLPRSTNLPSPERSRSRSWDIPYLKAATNFSAAGISPTRRSVCMSNWWDFTHSGMLTQTCLRSLLDHPRESKPTLSDLPHSNSPLCCRDCPLLEPPFDAPLMGFPLLKTYTSLQALPHLNLRADEYINPSVFHSGNSPTRKTAPMYNISHMEDKSNVGFTLTWRCRIVTLGRGHIKKHIQSVIGLYPTSGHSYSGPDEDTTTCVLVYSWGFS